MPSFKIKLYCSVAEAHLCEQLVQSHYIKVKWSGLKPATFQQWVGCPIPKKRNGTKLPKSHTQIKWCWKFDTVPVPSTLSTSSLILLLYILKNSADILNIINVSSTVRLSDRKIFQTQESMKTPSMPTATASGLSVSWTHKASSSYFDDCNKTKRVSTAVLTLFILLQFQFHYFSFILLTVSIKEYLFLNR